MAHCINIKHPEYIELLEKSGLKREILNAKISIWQEKNGLDKFPSVEELTYMGNRDNIDYNTGEITSTSEQKQQAQQLYSQYLESLNKPNTNPILQGNQQEQVKKFAELQERLNNKEFLEGAKNAYESSKGLQEWGTQEQYNDYIARVSLGIIKNPTSGKYNYESQVRDIVYHGGNANIDIFDKNKLGSSTGSISAKLGFFFTDNIEVANSYGKSVILEEIGELKELVVEWENTIKKAEENYNIKQNIADDLYKKTKSLLEKIKELIKKLLGYDFIKNNDLYKQALEDANNAYKEWENARITPKPRPIKITGDDFFKNYKSVIKDDPSKAVYSVILNIENPSTKDFINDPQDSGKWYSDTITQIKENNYDSAILTNVVDAGIRSHYTNEQWDEVTKSWERYVTPTIKYVDYYRGTDYVVFEPEQIHILGSKQDIEGFKSWVDGNQSNVLYQLQGNQEAVITPNDNQELLYKLNDIFEDRTSLIFNINNNKDFDTNSRLKAIRSLIDNKEVNYNNHLEHLEEYLELFEHLPAIHNLINKYGSKQAILEVYNNDNGSGNNNLQQEFIEAVNGLKSIFRNVNKTKLNSLENWLDKNIVDINKIDIQDKDDNVLYPIEQYSLDVNNEKFIKYYYELSGKKEDIITFAKRLKSTIATYKLLGYNNDKILEMLKCL